MVRKFLLFVVFFIITTTYSIAQIYTLDTLKELVYRTIREYHSYCNLRIKNHPLEDVIKLATNYRIDDSKIFVYLPSNDLSDNFKNIYGTNWYIYNNEISSTNTSNIFFFKIGKTYMKKWSEEFKTNIKNGIEAYMVLYYLDTNNLHIFVERLSIKMRKRRRKYNIINNKIFYIPTIKWIVYIAHSHGEWAEYIYAYSKKDKKWMLIKINNIGSRQL